MLCVKKLSLVVAMSISKPVGKIEVIIIYFTSLGTEGHTHARG